MMNLPLATDSNRPVADVHNEQLLEGTNVDPTLRLAESLMGCYTIGVYAGRV